MIKEGDKFKDCSTEAIYRLDNVGKDCIELISLNSIQGPPLHLKLDAVSKQDPFAKDKPLGPIKGRSSENDSKNYL